ncbi:ABC transporter ATP-binding protein [Schleiferilactobacillus perolens]|jgi:osmoprotectant transport system ATP-binding protein|uniref:ABC transporter ATP-binding protein n=1 Tax=Schleiferilactobacillus perolens TaxID=100468 RepID=UPI00235345BB|nr:ABC transporter ATP-binding protein [Schleiferilactobacillus perolens]MCI2170915.1 ABC transporter ATP-binding protein [Schleiferilactobacillus perolens]
MMAHTLIEFSHVKKTFDQKAAIKDLSFSVQEGEVFVLVGASGSGKTTTLRMVNELITPTAGHIFFDGREIKDYDRRALRLKMGYVLQQIALFPNMSVAQNVALIPSMKKQSKGKIGQLVEQLLADVDLDPATYRDRMPSELSGGEQQRVGILRAFAGQPEIVLMDEPFSALDPITRNQLQILVLTIHRKLHSTIIFVTHDMDEALKLGDRIGVMQAGNLLQVGTGQEIVQHPNNPFVHQLFEKSLAHDVYDVYLSKLKMLGYLRPLPTTAIGPLLSQDQTVRDALTALTESAQIQVKTSDGEGEMLTRNDLFRFMSDYRNH